MKYRALISTLIIGLLAASGVFLFRGGASEKTQTAPAENQKKAPKVNAITVSTASIARAIDLTGSVVPYRIARLASPAEGPVLDIRVREGDHVKAGDLLISIGRKKGIDVLRASLREELRKEEENLNRTRQLVESNALPGEQLDQARVAYEKVRAQLAKTEEMAMDYAIAAPWRGIVSRMLVKTGEFVAPRAALLEIYDPSSLSIRSAVPEKQAAAVKPGMRVDVQLDAYPGKPLKGRIDRVYPYLDDRLRTRTIEISIDEHIDLLPGMFARLKVQLETIPDAVVVPTQAVLFTPKGKVVFVVKEGTAVRRLVETGIEDANRIQIVSGVETGEKIIVAGNERLKDGIVVMVAGGKKPGKPDVSSMAEQPSRQKNEAGGQRE